MLCIILVLDKRCILDVMVLDHPQVSMYVCVFVCVYVSFVLCQLDHHHHHTTCYGASQPELSSSLHKRNNNNKKTNKNGPKNGNNTVSVQEMNVKIKNF